MPESLGCHAGSESVELNYEVKLYLDIELGKARDDLSERTDVLDALTWVGGGSHVQRNNPVALSHVECLFGDLTHCNSCKPTPLNRTRSLRGHSEIDALGLCLNRGQDREGVETSLLDLGLGGCLCSLEHLADDHDDLGSGAATRPTGERSSDLTLRRLVAHLGFQGLSQLGPGERAGQYGGHIVDPQRPTQESEFFSPRKGVEDC